MARRRDDNLVQRVLDSVNDPLAVLNRLGIEPHRSGGGTKILCPWHDESDPSCSVRTGDRDGQIRVKCFACGNGGSVLDLIRQVRQVDTSEALRIAAGWVGLNVEASAPRMDRERAPIDDARGFEPGRRPAQAVLAPERVAEYHDALLNDERLLELVMEQRALSLAVIEAARIGYDERRKALVIPYFLDRAPRYLKFKLPRGSKPAYLREPKGEVDFPFGIDSVPATAETVVVCEGELDCLVLHSLGMMNVVSVPNGAQSAGGDNTAKLAWLDHLERFRDIVICFDADEAGAKGAAALAWRLGATRCRVVKLPPGVKKPDGTEAKDPTDYVLAGAVEPLRTAILGARPIEHPLLDAVDQKPRDEFLRLLGFEADGAAPRQMNVPTGIPTLDRIVGGVRRGELTVIYGAPGAGKSVLANELLMRLLDAGERCAVVSLEMTRAQWLARMALRATGCVAPSQAAVSGRASLTQAQAEAIVEALARRGVYFMRAAGDTPISSVLECLEFAHRRYDVTFAVVDHLQRLQPDPKEEKDWRFNDQMTGQLESFAHRTGVGIIAPSHVTFDKRSGKNPRPSMMDGRGGSGASQNAACIIGLWRGDTRVDEAEETTSSIAGLKLRDGIGTENAWTAIGFDRHRQGFYEVDEANRADDLGMFGHAERDVPPPEEETMELDYGDAAVNDDGVPEGF